MSLPPLSARTAHLCVSVSGILGHENVHKIGSLLSVEGRCSLCYWEPLSPGSLLLCAVYIFDDVRTVQWVIDRYNNKFLFGTRVSLCTYIRHQISTNNASSNLHQPNNYSLNQLQPIVNIVSPVIHSPHSPISPISPPAFAQKTFSWTPPFTAAAPEPRREFGERARSKLPATSKAQENLHAKSQQNLSSNVQNTEKESHKEDKEVTSKDQDIDRKGSYHSSRKRNEGQERRRDDRTRNSRRENRRPEKHRSSIYSFIRSPESKRFASKRYRSSIGSRSRSDRSRSRSDRSRSRSDRSRSRSDRSRSRSRERKLQRFSNSPKSSRLPASPARFHWYANLGKYVSSKTETSPKTARDKEKGSIKDSKDDLYSPEDSLILKDDLSSNTGGSDVRQKEERTGTVRLTSKDNGGIDIWKRNLHKAVESVVEQEKPVVEKPVIEKSDLQNPVFYKQPVVAKPVMDRSVIVESDIDNKAIEKSILDKQVVEKPVTEKPVVWKPVFQKPVDEKPVFENPVIVKPVVQKSVIERLIEMAAVQEPVMERHTEKLVVPKSVDGRPVFENSVIGKQAIGNRIVGKPAVEKPVMERRVINNPIVQKQVMGRHPEKPVIQKPVNNKPFSRRRRKRRQVIEKGAAGKPVVQKPVAEKPVIQKPVNDKPVLENPVIEKRVIGKPAVEKPVMERHIDLPVMNKQVKPVAEKPVDQKSVNDKPVFENPAIEERAVRKPVIGKNAAKKARRKMLNGYRLQKANYELTLHPVTGMPICSDEALGKKQKSFIKQPLNQKKRSSSWTSTGSNIVEAQRKSPGLTASRGSTNADLSLRINEGNFEDMGNDRINEERVSFRDILHSEISLEGLRGKERKVARRNLWRRRAEFVQLCRHDGVKQIFNRKTNAFNAKGNIFYQDKKGNYCKNKYHWESKVNQEASRKESEKQDASKKRERNRGENASQEISGIALEKPEASRNSELNKEKNASQERSSTANTNQELMKELIELEKTRDSLRAQLMTSGSNESNELRIDGMELERNKNRELPRTGLMTSKEKENNEGRMELKGLVKEMSKIMPNGNSTLPTHTKCEGLRMKFIEPETKISEELPVKEVKQENIDDNEFQVENHENQVIEDFGTVGHKELSMNVERSGDEELPSVNSMAVEKSKGQQSAKTRKVTKLEKQRSRRIKRQNWASDRIKKIEQRFQRDSRNITTVVKLIASKLPEQEERLGYALKQVLQEFSDECMLDCKSIIAKAKLSPKKQATNAEINGSVSVSK